MTVDNWDDSVREHSEAPGAEPPDHPSESVLAAFLDSELASEERGRIEAHLERCAACRGALADTIEVLASDAGGSQVLAPGITRRRRRLPMLAIGVALAASIAGVVVLRRSPPASADAEGRTRDAAPSALDERIPRLTAIAPADGAARVAERPAFVWSPTNADRYSFRLLTEDGTTVWSSETADTTLTLPVDVRLGRGTSYFWRVDALAAGIVASTPSQRFTVAP
ncbi:MAG TPA: zf-HC2 domain-containing protein [Gemmatimonadaceae bacterium]|nr:zf-HC2 domain-containing protein [Gemmatimonadaceae bacterium]